jgi:hypothetical protein
VKKRISDHAGVLGSFLHVDALHDAVKSAKAQNIEVVDVFSPVPVEQLTTLLSPARSPVRFVTFVGGLLGIVGGFALGIVSAMIWDTVVGGKPVTNHVPFVVIAFEGLILLGALATFVALFVFGKLPYTRFPGKAYQPEFSKDRFGLWLGGPKHEAEKVREFLNQAGAVVVVDVGDEKGKRAGHES